MYVPLSAPIVSLLFLRVKTGEHGHHEEARVTAERQHL